MNIVPWRNKRPDGEHGAALAHFENAFDNLLDSFWRDPFGAAVPSLFRDEFTWSPALELSETEQQVTARVELPGLKPEDIDIRVAQDTLAIRGQKRAERSEKRGGYQYSERHFGQFARSVPLPATVDADHVNATFKDGVLTIVLQKKPEAQSRKVQIKALPPDSK